MEYPKYITGIKELNLEIQNNNQKKIMLVFTASWCGPCQKLKNELISTNQDGSISGIQVKYQDKLIILYIDVDESENQELMEIYEVSGMPTQVIIKPNFDQETNRINIDKVYQIVGYDMIKLRMHLEDM